MIQELEELYAGSECFIEKVVVAQKKTGVAAVSDAVGFFGGEHSKGAPLRAYKLLLRIFLAKDVLDDTYGTWQSQAPSAVKRLFLDKHREVSPSSPPSLHWKGAEKKVARQSDRLTGQHYRVGGRTGRKATSAGRGPNETS